ncbi:hypothetical protein [Epilithonimonas hungarica]|uniref:Uncharacterized protein n=1 Tax=Epilithonimonas hungarica TaxID=454006 RepID=A0A1G7TPW7_9FLAO|nr:hypothetical protein [Epilithonimonas hungarica]SDG37373.1 hypothetical protein SAMN05421825_3185 [Epilithonimonas hungarica]
MRNYVYLFIFLSAFLVNSCIDSSQVIALEEENVKNVDFKSKSREEKASFMIKCLRNPISMGMIKFDRTNIKKYKITNKSLEKLLIESSYTKDAYFYGEFFTIKSREIITDDVSKKRWETYYSADSQLSMFTGAICSNLTNCWINDANYSPNLLLDHNAVHHLVGYGGPFGDSGTSFYSWDFDIYGESNYAVESAPTGEVFHHWQPW